MLQVRKELCLGCGLCTSNCPQQAISMFSGQAEINQNKCRECRICIKICPQKAIVELATVSNIELQATVASLKEKTEDLIKRIERIKQSKPDLSDISHK